MRWRPWASAVLGAMALAILDLTPVQGDDSAVAQERPDWVWDARIFFLGSIQPRTEAEADAYLDWLEKYGYNVVFMEPDLGKPLPVSPEDPRLYNRPVWEWEWQGDPEQNRVFKYFTQAAMKRGIRVFTHQMVWSINAVDDHYEGMPIKPEWWPITQQTRDGMPVFEGPYRLPESQRRDPNRVAHIWLCPVDPKVEEAMRDVVPRMMQELGVEMLMGDWGFNGFQCDNPSFGPAYEADTGQRWPSTGNVGTPDFGGYRDWIQGQLLVRALADSRKGIQAANPDAIIFGYNSEPTRGEFETMPVFADMLGDEVSVRSSFYDWPWQMAVLKYNLAVSQHYNVPVVEFYSTDSYTENLFAWALTHAMGLKMWRLWPWFSQWEAQHADLLNRPRPVRKDMALLYSRQTYVRYSDNTGVYWTGQADDGRPHHPYDFSDYDEQQEGGHGWAGWARVLQDRHQPYDVILDGDVTPKGLSPYRVLILANAAALSDQQLDAIRGFVRSGGTLISDYQTSLFDEKAQQRPDFGLEDVLGVHYKGLAPPSWQWGLGPGASSFFNDVFEASLAMPLESQWVAEGEAAPSSRVLATYQGEGRSIPALVLNQYGDGRSLFFSGYPGSETFFRRKPVTKPDHQLEFTYNDFTDLFYRQLLDATIAHAAPEPYLVTDLPPEVIVNPLWCGSEDQTKLCLHVLNALGSRPINGTVIAPEGRLYSRRTDPLLERGFPGGAYAQSMEAYEGIYQEGSYVAPFPKYPDPIVLRVRERSLVGGYVISPDFEGQQPIALTRDGAYTVVTVPSLERYSIVVLDWAPPGSPQPAPSQPNFESLIASALPAPTAEEGSQTPGSSPLAAVARETPMPVPASASVDGRAQPQEDDSYSALTLPGWVVGAGAAFVTVVLIVGVGVWRSSTR